ncbi:Ger(x)C family spore germination protein [Bacillus suaedaesalsae]|uniref:Ger(X)C family spore germination protein n=1 Tax=Bacillus suaedaesalsae TaxID=2810349 RepID=A0ABS2DLL3_9BACI|nr:Ger(x)C family spore germination protein [Bacillus suaedaesalsae]MBM6619375.1 Ger(x)C family spore germination protein [Bacillus suaedaesalsae]
MKIRILLLLAISLCLLTGCWDRVELNDIGIVTGLAVEKGKDHKYKLTVEVLNATENSKMEAQGNAPATIYSQEGNSLSELAHRMNVGVARQLIYSHTRVFLIDEQVAKQGVTDFIDFLERSGEFRNDFNIFLFEGGNADDALKTTYTLQKVSSLKLNKQIESFYKEWGGDPNVRLTDFISALTSDGREPTIAMVKVKGDPKKGNSVENMQKVEPEALVEVAGLAVFKGDKLVDKLTINDTRNYLWLDNIQSTSLTVPCEGEEGNYLDLRVTRSHTDIDSKVVRGVPQFSVAINVESRIEGSQCEGNLERIDTYEEYEKQVENTLEDQVNETVQKVQELESDIFGFGEIIQRQHYHDFQNMKNEWNKYFADAKVEIKANVFIRRSGIRNQNIISDSDKY